MLDRVCEGRDREAPGEGNEPFLVGRGVVACGARQGDDPPVALDGHEDRPAGCRRRRSDDQGLPRCLEPGGRLVEAGRVPEMRIDADHLRLRIPKVRHPLRTPGVTAGGAHDKVGRHDLAASVGAWSFSVGLADRPAGGLARVIVGARVGLVGSSPGPNANPRRSSVPIGDQAGDVGLLADLDARVRQHASANRPLEECPAALVIRADRTRNGASTRRGCTARHRPSSRAGTPLQMPSPRRARGTAAPGVACRGAAGRERVAPAVPRP